MAKRGIFWLIDDNSENVLIAKIFEEGATLGISKSGDNYNHRLMWDHVKPRGCNKAFDYYPRGRVEMNSKGIPLIYMSHHIGDDVLNLIKEEFELGEKLKVHYDGSEHYKCHRDWENDDA